MIFYFIFYAGLYLYSLFTSIKCWFVRSFVGSHQCIYDMEVFCLLASGADMMFHFTASCCDKFKTRIETGLFLTHPLHYVREKGDSGSRFWNCSFSNLLERGLMLTASSQYETAKHMTMMDDFTLEIVSWEWQSKKEWLAHPLSIQ